MALATVSKNVFVGPEDGWVELVPAGSTINFIDIRVFPENHGIYVYFGSSIPTEQWEPIGTKLDESCFHMNVPTSAVGCWARCRTPSYGGGKSSDLQKTRVDVVVTTA